jgi:hypothetical protein
MPMPKKYIDEQIASRERSERSARRETTRDMFRTMGHILFWVVCGLALIGLALHSDNPDVGRVLWLAGQGVWLGGVLFSLLAAYRRGEQRGDW